MTGSKDEKIALGIATKHLIRCLFVKVEKLETENKKLKNKLDQGGRMSKEFKEALKELLRVVAISVVPVLISYAEAGSFSWREVALVGAIAALRFVDKWLHEEGVTKEDENLTKGLTRF